MKRAFFFVKRKTLIIKEVSIFAICSLSDSLNRRKITKRWNFIPQICNCWDREHLIKAIKKFVYLSNNWVFPQDHKLKAEFMKEILSKNSTNNECFIFNSVPFSFNFEFFSKQTEIIAKYSRSSPKDIFLDILNINDKNRLRITNNGGFHQKAAKNCEKIIVINQWS